MSRAIDLTLASGEESAFRTLAQHMGIVTYFGDLGLAPFKQFCEQALAFHYAIRMNRILHVLWPTLRHDAQGASERLASWSAEGSGVDGLS